ncbi:PREDICTED: uncharacterized protein LOC104733850 [Camelina sativa]|uniref:Uncharacterized protein LOC104733850 n=1 Tax=Camelina sativa TaxID=90675 RepID=A0ABM0V6M4_CAMSA|nr:PREDICTED: uncharacterized protein LOC104733850 [Camelina sativa]
MTSSNIFSEDGKKEPNMMKKTKEKIKSFFQKPKPDDHKEVSSQTSPYVTKALDEDKSYELLKIQQQLDERKFIIKKQNEIMQVQDKKMKNLTENSEDMRSKAFLLHMLDKETK